MTASAYHSQPSPQRVDEIIQMRNHRGGLQRWTRRISLRSRLSM
jgi:hypothetical protein